MIPVGDASLGAHLRQARRNNPSLFPEPVLPEFPHALQGIWGYFLNLHKTRQSGWVVGPISYREMLAWSELHGIKLRTWEIEVIILLDAELLKVVNDSRK